MKRKEFLLGLCRGVFIFWMKVVFGMFVIFIVVIVVVLFFVDFFGNVNLFIVSMFFDVDGVIFVGC